MRHIHRSQKPLERIGIYANRCTMRLYVIFLFGVAIGVTVAAISFTDGEVTEDDSMKVMAYYVGEIFYIPIVMLLDCLILSTLLDLSNKLEKGKAD